MPWTRQGPAAADWSESGSAILLTLEGEPVLTIAGDQVIFLVDQASVSWVPRAPNGGDWSLQA